MGAQAESTTAGEAAGDARLGSVKLTEDPNTVKSSLKFGGTEVDGGKLAYAEFRINHALHGEGEYNPGLAVKTAYELWGEIPEGGLNPVDSLPSRRAAEAYRENGVIGVDYASSAYTEGTRQLISTMLHESTHVADFQSGKYDALNPKLMEAVLEVRATARELAMAGRLGTGATNSGVSYLISIRAYQATFLDTLRKSPSYYNKALKGAL